MGITPSPTLNSVSQSLLHGMLLSTRPVETQPTAKLRWETTLSVKSVHSNFLTAPRSPTGRNPFAFPSSKAPRHLSENAALDSNLMTKPLCCVLAVHQPLVLYIITNYILKITLRGDCYNYPHFTDEEAQMSEPLHQSR